MDIREALNIVLELARDGIEWRDEYQTLARKTVKKEIEAIKVIEDVCKLDTMNERLKSR